MNRAADRLNWSCWMCGRGKGREPGLRKGSLWPALTAKPSSMAWKGQVARATCRSWRLFGTSQEMSNWCSNLFRTAHQNNCFVFFFCLEKLVNIGCGPRNLEILKFRSNLRLTRVRISILQKQHNAEMIHELGRQSLELPLCQMSRSGILDINNHRSFFRKPVIGPWLASFPWPGTPLTVLMLLQLWIPLAVDVSEALQHYYGIEVETWILCLTLHY